MSPYSESHAHDPLKERAKTPASVGEMVEFDKNKLPEARTVNLDTSDVADSAAAKGDPNMVVGVGSPADYRQDGPGSRDRDVFPGYPPPDRRNWPTPADQAYADKIARESNTAGPTVDEQREIGRQELEKQAKLDEQKAEIAERKLEADKKAAEERAELDRKQAEERQRIQEETANAEKQRTADDKNAQDKADQERADKERADKERADKAKQDEADAKKADEEKNKIPGSSEPVF